MTALETLLNRLTELERAATPGDWLYDYGNWEIESRNENYFRFGICPFNPDFRNADLLGDSDNQNKINNAKKHPFTGPEDAVFICESRNAMPVLIEIIKKQKDTLDYLDELLNNSTKLETGADIIIESNRIKIENLAKGLK